MSATLTQIKTAFEVEHMTPEQIAEDQGLELASVKAALMNSSVAYRKLCNKEEVSDEEYNFSNFDLKCVNKVILELALGAEDENLRGKMACYIRDDKKGRKEVVKQMGNNTFNILQLNEQISSARKLAETAKQKVIEVC